MQPVTSDRVYETVLDRLEAEPKIWLITGAAGFIGSNLVEALLTLNQRVVGLDNLATGSVGNLEEIRTTVGEQAWRRFQFVLGDITDLEICRSVCQGTDYVLHQAGLGSVPRSIEDPLATNRTNVDGFLNILVAARDCGVARVVYATSSSVYGDHPSLPKKEETIGEPLSPYAVSKYVNELYAKAFARAYGLETIGLRYFNVFGPRQDPDGPYAAVIPKWIALLLRNCQCTINGDGTSSRDFCFIANVVQANLLAATVQEKTAVNQVYNIAFSRRTTLLQLYAMLRQRLARICPSIAELTPIYGPTRPGDIPHSWADIEKAVKHFGYTPTHSVEQGLDESLQWYVTHLSPVPS